MIYHIIKPGDTIELIAKKYRLTIDEIISINPHFRSWEHLAPGAKLRLPEVSEVVKEELDSIEPFIEDYYPKINIDEILNNDPDYKFNIKRIGRLTYTNTVVSNGSKAIDKELDLTADDNDYTVSKDDDKNGSS